MGSFNVKHFLDPLGITPIGKGQGGGAKNFWDPAGVFTNKSAAATPAAAPAVPLPAPPVTQDNAAVLQAEHDVAQRALAQKSIRRTVIAGDTGGPRQASTAPTGQGKLGYG